MATRKGGTVDLTGISTSIARDPKFKKAASFEAQRAVNEQRAEFINEFENHKVTQEILAGPNAQNMSGTLGGMGVKANLFTFIGFEEGYNPVRPVRTILQSSMFITSVRERVLSSSANALVAVNVSLPTLKRIQEATPMPWEPGKSWLMGIEDGISGFGYYMYKKFERGRSKFGLQSKHKVRNSSFRAVPYFASMYDKFITKLTRL